MNILFLNAGRRCELIDAFRGALKHVGGGKIFASDITEYAPALYRADKVVILPHSSNSRFVKELSQFLNENDIELLIPTIDPDLVNLDKHREELKKLAPNTRLLLSPSDTIKYCRDKRLTKEKFRGSNIPVANDIDLDDIDKINYPVFVRPPSGSAGQGARIITDAASLKNALESDAELMVEEYIEGPEYTVDVLCDFKGKALIAVSRRRIRVRAGEVSQGIIELDDTLCETAKKAAENFGCHGPVTIQFKKDPKNRYIAIELNARMGGGLPLTIAAGGDWPAYILNLVQGTPPNVNKKIIDHMIMTRYDSSEFIVQTSFQHTDRRAPAEKLSSIWKTEQPPQSLIFDLDDTLFPEKDFVFSAYRAVAEKVWDDHKIEIEADLKKLFNSGRRGDLFTKVLKGKHISFDESYILTLVDLYRKHTPLIHPYVDYHTLPELRKKGFKLGLLTDGWKHVQQNKIDALKIAPYFDAILLSDTLGGPEFWKPSTAPYIKVCEKLGVSPDSAVYIGDNPVKDFSGARKLGMKTIRIRRPGTEHEYEEPVDDGAAPDAEISSLEELTDKW